MKDQAPRDHGGGLDAAIARFGGARGDWIDLSTGINRVPYPLGDIPAEAWTALPDQGAMDRLIAAARRFWEVPEAAAVIAAPGASALIAQIGRALSQPVPAYIPGPTYNEWAAAFAPGGAAVDDPSAPVHIRVHPNNPTGRLTTAAELSEADLAIVDESFCDVSPSESLVSLCAEPGTVVVKSFGKFWGLAGLRLGFVIGHPETLGLAPTNALHIQDLRNLQGPWPVAGPALEIGARALEDAAWAEATRVRLAEDAARLDHMMASFGATLLGGTSLFRLYDTADASAAQDHLARHRIWSRIFPYSRTWLRLGLPGAEAEWARLEQALA